MALVAGPTRAMILAASTLTLASFTMTLSGCDENDPVSADVVPAKIAGKTFHLELAAENAKRMKGLGGRTHIEDDGGMLFAFSTVRPAGAGFLMRDCPIDMDIIYCDAVGRVLTTYTMKAEPPRAADGSEGKEGEFGSGAAPGSPGYTPADKYEDRLPKYASHFPYQFVIEIQAGMVKKIGLKEGDQIGFDAAALKRRAH